MTNESRDKQLAVLRIAVGAGAWLAPDVAARLFGLDPGANPQARYLGRLFGIRDIALGVGLLVSREPQLWRRLGVVCDSADAAAGVLGYRDGSLPLKAAVPATAVALLAAGVGAASLSDA